MECRGARRTGFRLLIALVLATHACSLYASIRSPAVAKTQPGGPARDLAEQQLYGLKRVFLAVKNDIDSIFGEGRTPYILLRSRAAFDSAVEGLPESQRDGLTWKYLQTVALWQEFERVASAVLGPKYSGYAESYAVWHDVFLAGIPFPLQPDSAILLRDDLVSRMAALGYAPKEMADVVNGRLSLRTLDAARKMLLLGRSEMEISRYLEARSKPDAPQAPPVVEPPSQPAAPQPESRPLRRRSGARRMIFDPAVVKYAEKYGVDPHLVRAVIRHESNWNPEARSRVGAIGLMQLMPGTARLLGVNPFDPLQNIEGGVKYLAGLLTLFNRDLDATLLGYIGGPLYAKSWLQGKTVPYGEVRAYVQNVKASYLRQEY